MDTSIFIVGRVHAEQTPIACASHLLTPACMRWSTGAGYSEMMLFCVVSCFIFFWAPFSFTVFISASLKLNERQCGLHKWSTRNHSHCFHILNYVHGYNRRQRHHGIFVHSSSHYSHGFHTQNPVNGYTPNGTSVFWQNPKHYSRGFHVQ